MKLTDTLLLSKKTCSAIAPDIIDNIRCNDRNLCHYDHALLRYCHEQKLSGADQSDGQYIADYRLPL